MVQPAHARGADVHPRALAHGLETLEDRDVLGVVSRALVAAVLVDRSQVASVAYTCDAPAGQVPSAAGAWPSIDLDSSTEVPRSGPLESSKSAAKRHKPARLASLWTESRNGLAPERRVEPRDHPLGHQVELLRPRRRGAPHPHHAVALADRLRRPRERVAGGSRP